MLPVEEFQKFKEEHDKTHKQIADSLDRLHGKVDAIATVQVNGRVGLQESLQDIYYATKELRTEKQLALAYKNWLDQSFIGKVWHTKIGKISVVSALIFILISVAHSMGLSPITPVDAIRESLEFLLKVIK